LFRPKQDTADAADRRTSRARSFDRGRNIRRNRMPLSHPEAVPFGLLAMFAEDMYDAAPGTLAPPADSRIAAAGWKVVAYVTAQDVIIPPKASPDQTLHINHTNRVFYGYVAQSAADPTSYLAAIRGTQGIIEWLIDADFIPIPHPRYPNARVEQGFWSIYQTMSLADLAGVTTSQNVAEGIEKLVGGGRIMVVGHSLGSALATYFVEDVAERAPKATACLFASPRTGDRVWTTIFDKNVEDYSLFNYIIDVVPHVPSGIGYSTLSKAEVIQPSQADAGVRLDLLCDHHVICYCAMLDFQQTSAAPPSAQDTACRACILGPASTMPEEAKALAVLINAFGMGSEKARLLLKGMHQANAV
jgi:triacylglycerol lipase